MPFLLPLVLAGSAVLGGYFLKGELQPTKRREQADPKRSVDEGEGGSAELVTSAAAYLSHVGEVLSSRRRYRHMESLDGASVEISEEEQALDAALSVSMGGLAAAALSFVFPVAYLGVVASVFYVLVPVFKRSYEVTVKERRVSTHLVDVVFCTGVILSGYFRVTLLFSIFALLNRKLVIRSQDQTMSRIATLFGEQPSTAWLVLSDGTEAEVPVDDLGVGDRVVVGAGDSIPVDGVIVAGVAAIDQHRLTGESKPVELGVGESVLATTMVLSGRVQVLVEKSGADTVAAKVTGALASTASFQTELEARGERFADRSVLPSLAAGAALAGLVGFEAGVAVLASTFGYNMRTFGPTSLLAFLSIAADRGILIKDGRALETLTEVDTIIFDKTGTLTVEQPAVVRVDVEGDYSQEQVLAYAAAAEERQAHPIARAILDEARARGCEQLPSSNPSYSLGLGTLVELSDGVVRVGSRRFMVGEGVSIGATLDEAHERAHLDGASAVFVALGRQAVAVITLEARLRSGVAAAIQQLHARGLTLCILSGDHENPTRHLATSLGIETYFAETLPEGKAAVVSQLAGQGKRVCFVGDGINDAVAMKSAHVAVSLCGATSIATDTAQIILMDADLEQLVLAFELADRLERNMRVNFAFATVPSVISAGGVIFLGWGIVAGFSLAFFSLAGGVTNALWPAFSVGELSKREGDGPVFIVDAEAP